MKVLFLDIDGVLNSIVWTFVCNKTTVFSDDAKDDIDTRSVKILNILFEAVPDVKVVISSSWRKLHSIDEMREILGLCGLKAEIVDMTPNSSTGWRGAEVQAWIDLHPEVELYACIDDGSDFHPHQNLVQTDLVEGITLKDVYHLLQIFDNDITTDTHQDLFKIFR